MSFRLVPKSVTLNDFEWRNGSYFALFHGIRWLPGALRKSSWMCHRKKKFTFAISSPGQFLVFTRVQDDC